MEGGEGGKKTGEGSGAYLIWSCFFFFFQIYNSDKAAFLCGVPFLESWFSWSTKVIALENYQLSRNVHSDQWKLLFQDVKTNTMSFIRDNRGINFLNDFSEIYFFYEMVSKH